MRNWFSAMTAVVLALLVLFEAPSRAQEKKGGDAAKASAWMKKKLEFSQNILAGLTDGNFEKVSKNAAALNILTYLEMWALADSPEYKRQVSHFNFANLELVRQAREKNLDGATLAYTQLTISCVQCHKIVRAGKK